MRQLFEIIKRSPRPTLSALTVQPGANPAGTVLNVRGVAMVELAATPGQMGLADGSKPFMGFLTRNATVGGPALPDIIYPGRLELPFYSGQAGTTEFGEQIEAEGAQFIDPSITGATAANTPLTFANGMFAVATTGKYVEFNLVQQEVPNVAGNVRIRVQTVNGYVHA